MRSEAERKETENKKRSRELQQRDEEVTSKITKLDEREVEQSRL